MHGSPREGNRQKLKLTKKLGVRGEKAGWKRMGGEEWIWRRENEAMGWLRWGKDRGEKGKICLD